MKPFWFPIYLLVLALWVGGVTIFTFLVTPVVFGSFGRDLAAEIVGRMFPLYFSYRLAVSALALLVFLVALVERARPAARLSLVLLVVAVLANAYVSFELYPDALAAKRRVTSFEREAVDSPARREFTRLHAASAVLNLLVLAEGVVLVFAGARLGRRAGSDER